MASRRSDVLIIGGGIVGCACAYELAKRGASVALVEYGKTGMQATNAAAGMLAPLSEATPADQMLDAGLRALRAYPALVAELERACGFDLELRQDGILRVAYDEDDVTEMRERAAWQRDAGVDVQWIDAAACREVEPRISDRVLGGTLSAAEATVSNQLIALALGRAARAAGVDIREGAPVTRAKRSRGRITSLEAGGEGFAAATIVIAAGARSGQVGRKLGVALPVFPVRGQMIALGGMSCPIGRPVWGPDGYLVPRANGLVFAGATVERVGFRRRTTNAGVRAMRAMSVELVPQLAAAKVQFAWAGLRPGTPDALPIVGPVPATNVVAATGHYRSGILLGPMTGAWIADGIMTGRWDHVPAAFRFERFAG